MDRKILIRYALNQSNSNEIDKVRSWLSENEQNVNYFNYIKATLNDKNALANYNQIDVEYRWKELEAIIQSDKKQTKLFFLTPIWRNMGVAASIMICFFIGYFMLFANKVELIGTTTQHSFTLPDNSTIYIEEGSRVIYKEPFNRKLELIGNAFFTIEKAKQEFEVTNGESKITVLGTSFDVLTSTNQISTKLYEGKIRFDAGHKSVLLSPGDEVIFDFTSSNLNKSRFENKTLSLKFKSASLREICNYLEQYYLYKIQVEPALLEQKITCDLTGKNMQQVLSELAFLLDAQYEINKRFITIKK